jgi:hypothetical protein
MTEETDIAFPLRFNSFKHHRDSLLSALQVISPDAVIDLFDRVCNNYIDLYTGAKSPKEIGEAVISILKSKNALDFRDFSCWVGEQKGYGKIILDDGSEWVVRKSDDPGRYIHLHPARTGMFTFRFRGSTLKTVCLLRTCYPGLLETFSLGQVNNVRKQIGLSPVKRLEPGKGILHCRAVFFGSDFL